MRKFKKAHKLQIIITIIGVISIIVGVSYAIFQTINSSTKSQVILTGNISLVLTETSSGVTLDSLQEMSDVDGLLQDYSYDFTIKNDGTEKAKYRIYLIDDTEALSSYTGGTIDDQYVKAGLKINGVEKGPMSLAEVNRLLYEDIIEKDEVVSCELRLWFNFDGATDTEKAAQAGKAKLLNIKVEGEQILYASGTETTFEYTGDYQRYIVPADGYYYIEANGAQGGSSMLDGGTRDTSATSYDSTCERDPSTTGCYGGLGARTSGYVYLEKNEVLYIYVGGKGKNAVNAGTAFGGYNGGGTGDHDHSDNESDGAGGGATDIRYFGSETPNSADLVASSSKGLRSRIMVAGGGGGAHDSHSGLPGGTLLNINRNIAGEVKSSHVYSTQTSGNAFGIGKDGVYAASNYPVSGGGGGYYGGTLTPSSSSYVNMSGGGTSFISGYAGSNAVTNAITVTHSNNPLHYSGKYFLQGAMVAGANRGDGSVYIRYIGNEVKRTNTKLNNVRYIKDCINGNTTNTGNYWAEIQAMYNGNNVAKGKIGTLYNSSNTSISQSNSTTRAFSLITDGIIEKDNYSMGTTITGAQCFVIDLGSAYNLDEVAVWHYFADERSYNNHSLYVSSNNSTWTTLIDNVSGFRENENGIRISAYGQTNYFKYTGNYQEFTAEKSGLYKMDVYGAAGGKGICNGSVCGSNVQGGYSTGVVFLEEGETVYVYVGGAGTNAVEGKNVAGGYNGGGQGSWDGSDNEAAGGGGGATDIRYFGASNPTTANLASDSALGLNSRIIVAGGAGGFSWYSSSGAGGGLSGGVGYNNAAPGTQVSGNQFGIGQSGTGGSGDGDGTAGGGGGYYGGYYELYYGSAGGGSGFVSGYIGSVAISSSSLTNNPRTARNGSNGSVCTATSAKTDVTCSYHYSGKIFDAAMTISGVNSGDGKAFISYLGG